MSRVLCCYLFCDQFCEISVALTFYAGVLTALDHKLNVLQYFVNSMYFWTDKIWKVLQPKFKHHMIYKHWFLRYNIYFLQVYDMKASLLDFLRLEYVQDFRHLKSPTCRDKVKESLLVCLFVIWGRKGEGTLQGTVSLPTSGNIHIQIPPDWLRGSHITQYHCGYCESEYRWRSYEGTLKGTPTCSSYRGTVYETYMYVVSQRRSLDVYSTSLNTLHS